MTEKPAREVQPLCQTCRHPFSFHSGKVGMPCKALGCHCPAFISIPEVSTT